VGIFDFEQDALAAWPAMERLLREAGITEAIVPALKTLAEGDWRDSYKAHFHAWTFGRLHWVPIWERDKFQLPPGDSVLWLDPGLAFGTGNHETTRLCCERLVALAEELIPTNPDNSKLQTPNSKLRVVDAGCGSGILALSAALLGFPDVRGFDNDPEAVRVSKENAAANNLADRVQFEVADIPGGLASAQAEVILANIQADVLMKFAPQLVAAVAPGGTLVLSGILASENSTVRTTFEELTTDWVLNARVMEAWSDITLKRPG
jgi:ribosomal protein L11 methyltransferase